MAKNPKPERDDPEQSKRFEETAKELGSDESGKAFERAMAAVQASKPLPAAISRKRSSPAGRPKR